MIHSGQKLNRTRESKLKDQAVPDDFTKDVINNIENCEEPEWTIFSETVNEKGSEHCGSRLVESPCRNGRPGGGIQQSRRQ